VRSALKLGKQTLEFVWDGKTFAPTPPTVAFLRRLGQQSP
jgi:hypothetical protein